MVEVRDDGVGGADAGRRAAGCAASSDRVGALDGTLEVDSPRGAGHARARADSRSERRNVQHGEHAAVVLGAAGHAELGEDARDVLLDGVRRDDQRLGDALVRAPLGHQLEHLALARRQLVERIVAAAAAEHVRDDRRVERRAAGGDAPDGVGEAARSRPRGP